MKAKKIIILMIVLGLTFNLSAQEIDSILTVKEQYNMLVIQKRSDKAAADRSEVSVIVSIYQSNDRAVNPSFEVNGLSFILDKFGTGLLYLKPGKYKFGCRYFPFDLSEKMRVNIRKGYDYVIEFILKKGVVTVD